MKCWRKAYPEYSCHGGVRIPSRHSQQFNTVAPPTVCVRASSLFPRFITHAFPARPTSPPQLRATYDTVSTFSIVRTSPSERDHHSSRERRKNQTQVANRLVYRLIATLRNTYFLWPNEGILMVLQRNPMQMNPLVGPPKKKKRSAVGFNFDGSVINETSDHFTRVFPFYNFLVCRHLSTCIGRFFRCKRDGNPVIRL